MKSCRLHSSNSYKTDLFLGSQKASVLPYWRLDSSEGGDKCRMVKQRKFVVDPSSNPTPFSSREILGMFCSRPRHRCVLHSLWNCEDQWVGGSSWVGVGLFEPCGSLGWQRGPGFSQQTCSLIGWMLFLAGKHMAPLPAWAARRCVTGLHSMSNSHGSWHLSKCWLFHAQPRCSKAWSRLRIPLGEFVVWNG